MKKILVLFIVANCFFASLAAKKDPEYSKARKNGAEAKIHLRIVDDVGIGVSNVSVRVFMGMNFRSKGYWIDGVTDKNGYFIIQGKTCGDEVEIFISKNGYYDSHEKLCFAEMGKEHNVENGKWQPYEEKYNMIIRKVRNPQAIGFGGEYIFTKKLNQWLGFDIHMSDFVYPYGNGKISDFEIMIDWDGKWLPDYTGMGISIRFVVPFSGYYEIPIQSVSKLKGPYIADSEKEYQKTAVFFEKVVNSSERIRKSYDQSKCWVVRSRCKVDKDGNLISSNYSVIHKISFCGEIDGSGGVRVIGAYNPTPNDTNIEPKR
jgi:hypothetical protein